MLIFYRYIINGLLFYYQALNQQSIGMNYETAYMLVR